MNIYKSFLSMLFVCSLFFVGTVDAQPLDISDIDKTAPQIKLLNGESDTIIIGRKDLKFLVTDYYGVKELTFSHGGRVLYKATNLDFSVRYTQTFDAFSFRAGEQVLNVKAVDYADNVTEVDFEFFLSTTPITSIPSVSILEPVEDIITGRTPIVISAKEKFPIKIRKVSVLLNGILLAELTSPTGSNYSYLLNSASYPDGLYLLQVIVENNVFQSVSTTKEITLFNNNIGDVPVTPIPPVVTPSPDQPTPTPAPETPNPVPNPEPPVVTPSPVVPQPSPVTPGDEDTLIVLQQMIASVTQLIQLVEEATQNGESSEELTAQVLSAIAQITAFLNTLSNDNTAELKSFEQTRNVPKIVKRTRKDIRKALKAKKKRKRNRRFKKGLRKLKRIQKALG